MNLATPFFEGARTDAPDAEATAPIASLDGIRAIAVSLVFLAHGGLADKVPGGLGVTMFFVLSGFLITTLMRKEYARYGTLDVGAFYLRRFLRLTPPLLLAVALALVIHAIVPGNVAPTPLGVAAVIFYFSNYFALCHGEGIPSGLGGTWSLAVEEHFYLLFPLLALMLLRCPRAAAAACLGLLCAAMLGWRCWLFGHGAASGRIYLATDTRADAILIGCAMALACNPVLDAVHLRLRRHTTAIMVVALGVTLATLTYRSEYFRNTARFTIQSLAIATLIYLAVAQSRHAAFRCLNARPVAYLGKLSYSVYLTHQLCLLVVSELSPALGMPGTLSATAILALAMALPMRLWVELPCADIRRRLSRRRARHSLCVPSRRSVPVAGGPFENELARVGLALACRQFAQFGPVTHGHVGFTGPVNGTAAGRDFRLDAAMLDECAHNSPERFPDLS